MAKYNPFRPNSIVNAGMFCGRGEELEATERSLFQTKNGNPKHFLVTGERGIGKSSLMLAVDFTAKGEVDCLDGNRLNFVAITVELIGSTTYEDIVRCIAMEFRAEAARRQRVRAFAASAWDFISNWSVMGVEYKKPDDTSNISLIDSLCDGMSAFLKAAGDGVDGIVILIDEADKPAEEAKLGEFCKIFTEKMTKLRCDRVCLGLAGLPSIVSKLRASHESSPRIFEALSLEPLEPDECKEVVEKGLAEATTINGVSTAIEAKALEAIVRLSEGYPHFIQQFSYSAFEEDQDNNITLTDVNNGAFKPNGALDQLGNRYFSELYFEKISSEDYRKVIDAMADKLDAWMTRAQIIKGSGVKDTQANNALKALRERGIILLNPEKQGEYRLPTKSFAVWIRALGAKRRLQSRKRIEPGEG